jgi:hypothetical protein
MAKSKVHVPVVNRSANGGELTLMLTGLFKGFMGSEDIVYKHKQEVGKLGSYCVSALRRRAVCALGSAGLCGPGTFIEFAVASLPHSELFNSAVTTTEEHAKNVSKGQSSRRRSSGNR